jgi:hypothetical protein
MCPDFSFSGDGIKRVGYFFVGDFFSDIESDAGLLVREVVEIPASVFAQMILWRMPCKRGTLQIFGKELDFARLDNLMRMNVIGNMAQAAALDFKGDVLLLIAHHYALLENLPFQFLCNHSPD